MPGFAALKALGKSMKERFLRKPRSPNGKRLLFIVFGTILGLILLTGGTLKVTSTNGFCQSCHEMAPEVATWKTTSHTKFTCVTCHTEAGVVGGLQSKFKVFGFMAKHVTGKMPQTIATEHPIQNSICESCHSSMRKVTASGDINIPHDKHLKQGIACVACHAGVAHGFVAERGLSNKADYASWTAEKAEKVIKFDDTKTAMEACMDCHEQVNQGKKPWLENEGLGKTEKQRVADQEALKAKAANSNGKLPQNAVLTSTKKSDLQAPMRCAPCHLQIKTPVNHVDKSWGTTHGITASQDVRWCAECHSRQKDRVLITAQTTVQDYARNNTLCAPCHEKRPAGHLENKEQWLPTHSKIVKDKGAQNCLVCHEIDKAIVAQKDGSEKKIPGVNPVTCNTCHWFKNGKIEFRKT